MPDTVPASSTIDPLQDTAEPIREAGGAPGKTYLRKGQNTAQTVRSEEKSVRNSPVSTKVREEGAGGSAPGARPDIPLQLMERPWWSRYPHCRPQRGPLWSKWIFPEGTVAL